MFDDFWRCQTRRDTKTLGEGPIVLTPNGWLATYATAALRSRVSFPATWCHCVAKGVVFSEATVATPARYLTFYGALASEPYPRH